MPEEYVALDRLFERAGDGQEDRGDYWGAGWGSDNFDEDVRTLIRWPEILAHSVVVVIGEPGTGKTEEVQNQVLELDRASLPAFYTTVKRLADAPLEDALDEIAEARFREWENSTSDAWFFIDSIDEARSTGAEFELALSRLSRTLRPNAHRAHVVITTRPIAWFGSTDRLAVERHFHSVLRQPRPKEPQMVDDPLLDPLFSRRKPNPNRTSNDRPTVADQVSQVGVLKLLPLNSRQIREFVRKKLPSDPDGFLQGLENSAAAVFLDRPLDLLDAMEYWRHTEGCFGSKTDQLHWSIERKLREADSRRLANVALTPAEAKSAARQLAAALLLGHKGEIAIDAAGTTGSSTQVVDASRVLPKMPPSKLNDLADRALFRAASHGTIRLIRDYQDFLAADWFLACLESGLAFRDLLSILCVTIDGKFTLRPSFRTVAPWLAQRSSKIRKHLVSIAPILMFESGDREMIPASERLEILEAYIDCLDQVSRYRPLLTDDEARWFSAGVPESVIRKLWQRHAQEPRVRVLLLKIVAAGRRTELVDLAARYISRRTANHRVRCAAICTIGTVAPDEVKGRLAAKVSDHRLDWPVRHIGELVESLFPEYLSVADLGPMLSESDIEQGLPQDRLKHALAKNLDMCSERDLAELTTLLRSLLTREPTDNDNQCPLSIRFCWVAPVLQRACEMLLSRGVAEPMVYETARELGRLANYRTEPHVGMSEIGQIVRDRPALRESMLVHALRSDPRLRKAPWMASHYWPLTLVHEDAPWLMKLVRELRYSDIREQLFSLTFGVIGSSDCRTRDRRALGRIAKNHPGLQRLLVELDAERKEAIARDRPHKARVREIEAQRARRDAVIVRNWRAFRAKLQKRPSLLSERNAVPAGEPSGYLVSLHRWIRENHRNIDRFSVASSHFLDPVFGTAVRAEFDQAMMTYWRTRKAPLVSANRKMFDWDVLALAGIAIEAQRDSAWAKKLSRKEAKRAAEHATCEMNGFPNWLGDLVVAHRQVVQKVFRHEFRWELQAPADGGNPARFHCASRLASTPAHLQDALVPVLLEEMRDSEVQYGPLLERCLGPVLNSAAVESASVAAVAVQKWSAYRALTNPKRNDTYLAHYWLAMWYYRDAVPALAALEEFLARLKREAQDEFVATFVTRLVERDQLQFPTTRASFDQPAVLKRLVGLAYTHVRLEDDRGLGSGVHVRNARDDQEGARGGLRERATRALGSGGVSYLRGLASQPYFRRIAKHLDRAASDLSLRLSDIQPWREQEVAEFEERGNRPVRTSRDLFEIAMNTLLDVKDDTERGDFSLRDLLSQSKRESDYQVYLAGQLNQRARGRYTAVRENQVGRGTKPDVSVLHPDAGRVPIEIKVADAGWGYKRLLATGDEQVIGKYLADREAIFGILVVVRVAQKRWRHPQGGYVDFGQLVAELEVRAYASARRDDGIDGVKVISIDLM